MRDHVVGVARATAHLVWHAERSAAHGFAAALRAVAFAAAVHWAEELAADTRDRTAIRRLSVALDAVAVAALVPDEQDVRAWARAAPVTCGPGVGDAAFVLPWRVAFVGAADPALVAAMSLWARVLLWWSTGRHRSRAALALG